MIIIIILNEKKYVDSIIQSKELDVKKTSVFLSMYARYLYFEKGFKKLDIIKELNSFMEDNYPRYNPLDWAGYIEKYTVKASKYPLCECHAVSITEHELSTIDALQNKVLERLAFTLLCLAKFRNFRNPNNNNWINYSNGEIYKLACINTTAYDKDLKLNQLKELGLIEYAKKVDNLSIRILYINNESKPAVSISDFRKLGYEWRLHKEENYIRCAQCGILVKKKTGTTKYCSMCKKVSEKEKTKLRVTKYRARCNASVI